MTYETLRLLAPEDIVEILSKQVENAKEYGLINSLKSVPFMQDSDDKLTPPTLLYVGDFEIRARFHTIPNEKYNVGRYPHL